VRKFATFALLIFGFAWLASGQTNVSSPSPLNLSQIAGTAAGTATAGVLKVGVVGNAGGAVDAATNAAAPANILWQVQAPSTATGVALTSSTKATLTASVNVKATAGNVYGVFAMNGAASTCWIQFINSATAGTLGTGVILSVPLPASTTQPIWLNPGPLALASFSSGIAVGIATTATGASACGTGGNVDVFYQ
jgi:hypothetical protein